MTYSELDKWRKIVPFFIFGMCLLPWFLVTSESLADVKAKNELIVPICAAIAAFFYVGFNIRDVCWKGEVNKYVGRQIRDGLLELIPADLNVTEEERRELQGEVFKKLTGVFWESIDGDQQLSSHKEFFYSNGILYTTSIDVFLICGLAGLAYVGLGFFDPLFLYWGAFLIAISLASKLVITRKARLRHLTLSREQLDLLRRRRGDFVRDRFEEIITGWRNERNAVGS